MNRWGVAMSAEKEMVNFWLNRKGYFTINHLKTGNKDIGLLALKFEDGVLKNIMHMEVHCSLTGFVERSYVVEEIIDEKFEDKNVNNEIRNIVKNIDINAKIEKVIVLNSLPKDGSLIKKLSEKNIEIREFESILREVIKGLKTNYFKNDTIRVLQIVKFLLISNPKEFVSILHDTLSQQKMREFLAELLGKEEIIREFKKTNEERLALIMKQSMIKPEKLALMLENEVLNRKTRRPFINSLIEQEKSGKIYKQAKRNKREMPLIKFFE